ncbi:MAG TPA: MFS transporter [Terriglobales bacterium]|nr:MFS transporter [Terriglobales bacterium]
MSAPASATAAAHEPRSYRFLIEILLFFSYFVFGLSWIGYSPFLKDIQAQFALDYAKTGLVISSVSFAKIFLPFVAGIMAVRLGVARSLLIGNLCICASLFTPFAGNFTEFVASRIVFGIGGAIVVTLLGPAVLQWFPRSELAIVNGFNYVAVNSGITLSLFITIPLASSYGRNHVLTAYAVISAAIFVAWLLFGRDRYPAPKTKVSATAGYLEIIKMKEAWWLTLAAAGPLCVYLVFNTWLPTFYKESLGLAPTRAAQLTGLANMVGIPSAIIGGLLAQATGRRKPFILAAGLLTGCAAFGLFLTSNVAILSISAVIFGIGLFLWVAPLTTLAMEIPDITPQKLAVLNGVFFSVGYLLAFFAPLIAGALRDATGSFIPGFVAFSLFSFSLLFGGMMLKEHKKA